MYWAMIMWMLKCFPYDQSHLGIINCVNSRRMWIEWLWPKQISIWSHMISGGYQHRSPFTSFFLYKRNRKENKKNKANCASLWTGYIRVGWSMSLSSNVIFFHQTTIALNWEKSSTKDHWLHHVLRLYMGPPINPCDHRTHDVSRTMMVRIPALSHHVLIVTQMALSWSVLATGPDHRTSCIAAIHCSVRWSVRDARVSASSVFWCSSIWKFRVVQSYRWVSTYSMPVRNDSDSRIAHDNVFRKREQNISRW